MMLSLRISSTDSISVEVQMLWMIWPSGSSTIVVTLLSMLERWNSVVPSGLVQLPANSSPPGELPSLGAPGTGTHRCPPPLVWKLRNQPACFSSVKMLGVAVVVMMLSPWLVLLDVLDGGLADAGLVGVVLDHLDQ